MVVISSKLTLPPLKTVLNLLTKKYFHHQQPLDVIQLNTKILHTKLDGVG